MQQKVEHTTFNFSVLKTRLHFSNRKSSIYMAIIAVSLSPNPLSIESYFFYYVIESREQTELGEGESIHG